MNKNPLHKGVLTENFIGIGSVTRNMVLDRACELALIAGRAVSQTDYEQAKRELTGGSEMDPQQAMLESIPEDKRWDPIPGSTGHRAKEFSFSEDEDEDGRSESAQLFEEGVKEAEHDQMVQAALAAENKYLHDL